MTGTPNKPTPVAVENRAGLPAIRTRVGTHSTHLDAMRRGLADANRPGLSELRTRAQGDFTLGLLDAWAGVCDTLSFYGERQANEAYLRTATSRESVRAHARLVGYELSPAKAAGTFFAFEAETNDAPAETLTYGAGLQVRSIPRDGEIPQLFETIAPLTARADWNAMTPRMAHPQTLDANAHDIQMTADAPRLVKGDPVVFLRGKTPVASTIGASGFLRRITSVTDGLGGRKIAALVADPTSAAPYVFTAHPPLVLWNSSTALTTSTLQSNVLSSSWSVGAISSTVSATKVAVPTLNLAITALIALQFDPILPYVLRVRAGFFGNIAISKRSSPVDVEGTVTGVIYATSAPSGINDTRTEIDDDAHPANRYFIYLDREFPEITAGQILLVRDAVNEAHVTIHAAESQSIEGYSMSAKVTRLEVDREGRTPSGGTLWLSNFDTRTAVAYTVPEALPLSDLPITAPIGESDGGIGPDQVEMSTAQLMLMPGKTVAVAGELANLSGVTAAEIRTIQTNVLNGGFSVLTFTQPLANTYLRDTVRLCANVAEATHGETQTEVLGDGDATRVFQTYRLKSAPLTHVSARTTSGMAPALEVRVDNILWDLVDDFRGAGPQDRVYLLRIMEDGTSHIVFGDGITGQRLSTGQDNVTAIYRKGAGFDGHLEARQLSLLATKPAGLKGVVNPLAPSGAADAEALEDARTNTPLKVLTLGRVVSLRDYEDFAQGFAAIAKARADWTFDGFARPIFLTVAGQQGAILPESGADMVNLVAALRGSGESDQRVTVRNYAPVEFGASARIYIDPAYGVDDVLGAVRAALLVAFSFDARTLGHGVSHAQLIAVAQSVAGVKGVDLETLYRLGTPAVLQSRLRAAVSQPDLAGKIPDPAELLTLNAGALILEAAQ